MAYCSKCGAASNGQFCAQCGAPIQRPAAPAPQPPQQPYPYAQQGQYAYVPPPPKKSNGLLIGLGVVGGLVAVGLGVFLTQGGSSSAPAGSSSSPAASSTRARAGYVTGSVLDERGAAMNVAADQVVIRITGTRASDSTQVTGLVPVQSGGRFEMKVPDGTYKVTGYVKVNFEGKEYWLSLEPSIGADARDSKAGIAVDMRMKLSGQRPGYDAKNPYSYYGGYVSMQYQGRTLPDDAQVKFTLTPLSPLADGSQGKPLTFTATGAQLRSNPSMKDIPLARYRITGEVTLPNGTKKAALISKATGGAATTQEFTFPAVSTGEGVEGVALWMMGEQ